MNINGICYIAKKYQQQEKDFERSQPNAYGKVWAKGKITWVDKSKDKNGDVLKSYTTKRFACFDPMVIDTLEACKNDLLVIEGQLKGESYIDKNGEKKEVEKIYISKVSRYDKSSSPAPQPVQEMKAPQAEFDEDDIPF